MSSIQKRLNVKPQEKLKAKNVKTFEDKKAPRGIKRIAELEECSREDKVSHKKTRTLTSTKDLKLNPKDEKRSRSEVGRDPRIVKPASRSSSSTRETTHSLKIKTDSLPEHCGSSKNLATNRLTRLRDQLKLTEKDIKPLGKAEQVNRKHQEKGRLPNIPISSTKSNITKNDKNVKSSRGPLKAFPLKDGPDVVDTIGSTKVPLRKSPSECTSNNKEKSPLKTSEVQNKSSTPLNKRSPNKNLASDRLKQIKKSYSLKSSDTPYAKPQILKSPVKKDKPVDELKKSPIVQTSYESPLKSFKKHVQHDDWPKITLLSPNDSETNIKFPDSFITISEASDSEGSRGQITPLNKRLLSIRNSSSTPPSNSKTLTPPSSEKSDKSNFFKSPIKVSATPKFKDELKVPQSRNIFGNRSSELVQQSGLSKGSIFGNTNVLVNDTSHDINITKPIQTNIFKTPSPASEKAKNIFEIASSSPNIINHENKSVPIIAPPKSIFSSSPNEFTVCHSIPKTSVISPTNLKEQIGTECENTESISLSEKCKSKKSLNDRFARIKQGISTSLSVNGSLKDNSKTTTVGNENMEVDQLESGTIDNVIQYQTCSKQLFTENWLDDHKGSREVEEPMTDSLIVNVDDTILNKTDLPDPQEDLSMEWDSVPQTSTSPLDLQVPLDSVKKENAICIVTDTNVFMHFLHKIRDIINFKLTGTQKVKIFIPWMVLHELDYLKDHNGGYVKETALNAGKFINNIMTQSDSKMLGQSVTEMVKQKDLGSSPDDKILATCMQCSEKFESVILLTNDINLRTKALVNQIEPCSPQDVLRKLQAKLTKNTKSKKIDLKVGKLCSQIICEVCQEAYGNVWSKMDMLQNPPWSLLECLKRFKKYWASVFRDKMLKQFLSTVEALLQLLSKNNNHISDGSENFNEFMKHSLELLVFLKDLPGHKGSVQNTIEDVIQTERDST